MTSLMSEGSVDDHASMAKPSWSQTSAAASAYTRGRSTADR
jgi:hypothetical protein